MGAMRRWGIADDGAAVEVTIPPGHLAELVARWPPRGLALQRTAAHDPIRHLRIRTRAHATTAEVDSRPAPGGWDRIESELAVFAAERLTGLVAVHAAVIAAGGRAMVVPGASGTGKSRLCVAAAALGARVLSDEYALVDPLTGNVTGWQRPIRVRRRDGSGSDRLNLTVPSPPLRVALVAALAHTTATDAGWHEIGPSEAVIRLLENTVCASSRPDDAIDAAVAVAETARCVAGTRGEAAAVIGDLISLLDDETTRLR